MIPRPAQFLLRFDDFCPTMNQDRWQRFLPLIENFAIRPILAVIPDNHDPSLNISPPDPEFWARMRAMEESGAMIGLHGYRHLCLSPASGLLPLHRHTEFAGVPQSTQREWIREGLALLRGHGLNPTIFVAPRHGFDRGTLKALRKEDIHLISDGLARTPFKRGGLTWIPQQLWGPQRKSKGLWTICVHSNSATSAQVEELHSFLRSHVAQFTSIDRVLGEFSPARLGLTERLYQIAALWRIRISRARSRRFHPSRKPERT